MLPAMTTVPSSNTVRTLALAFAATLLSTTSGPAQAASAPARAAPIATVTDFAAAEAAIPKARTDLHEHDYSWNWRVAPDGKVAWLVMHPSQLTAPAKEQQRDRLELLVADGAGGTPRATSLDASFCWGPGEHCGPVWGSDGKSLLVGYHTEGTEFVTDVRIDRVRAGAAPGTFLRETGAHLLSIGQSRDGNSVAVLLDAIYPPRTSLCVCDRDGKQLTTMDLTGKGCRVASPSPDGSQVAVVMDNGLCVVATRGGEPRLLVATPKGTMDTSCPQWLDDGKAFVVAVGGDVVLASVEKGELHRWTARDLGGPAVTTVVTPGDTIGGAVVTHESEATALDLLQHAGDAPKRVHAELIWLDLRDGSHARSRLKPQRFASGRVLHYVPRISELLAACAR